VRAGAAAAEWTLPRTTAAIACPEEALERLARRLPTGTIAAQVDGMGCAVVSDPDGPGRPAELDRALAESGAAVGPTFPLTELAASWSLARATLLAAEAGALAGGPLRADDLLVDLLIFGGRPLVDRLAARRLSALDDLTPSARRRMAETAYAYVRERGNAAAMARALDLHPQTVRYRLARLRELLGEQLDDPDARLELELALRAQRDLDPA
jgi:DNA-binding PucR family transcriptional regulator